MVVYSNKLKNFNGCEEVNNQKIIKLHEKWMRDLTQNNELNVVDTTYLSQVYFPVQIWIGRNELQQGSSIILKAKNKLLQRANETIIITLRSFQK